MALIEDAKVAVRLTNDDPGLVNELRDLISAARADLQTAGVREEIAMAEDAVIKPLVKTAIIFYLKANWGFDNDDAERYERRYDEVKRVLCIDAEYGRQAVQ